MSRFAGRYAWFRDRAHLTGDTLSRERHLYDAMERNPDDEDAKIHYEKLLAQVCPDAIELELLRRQRELAQEFRNWPRFEKLVNEFAVFRTEHSSFFWNSRGFIDPMFRRFKLWLVDFDPERRFAVYEALKLNVDKSIHSGDLPIELGQGHVESMYNKREGIIGFVRRYRGPTGDEPDVRPNEIVLLITPSWSAP